MPSYPELGFGLDLDRVRIVEPPNRGAAGISAINFGGRQMKRFGRRCLSAQVVGATHPPRLLIGVGGKALRSTLLRTGEPSTKQDRIIASHALRIVDKHALVDPLSRDVMYEDGSATCIWSYGESGISFAGGSDEVDQLFSKVVVQRRSYSLRLWAHIGNTTT